MNKLPKSIINRWSVLLIVVVVSLLGTFVISSKYSSNNTNSKENNNVIPTAVSIPTQSALQPEEPVRVKLDYNLAQGYIDVYISNPVIVEHGELLFTLSGNARFTKVEEDTLFEKYLTSNETDKVTGTRALRLGATRGIEGNPVSPASDQKFARVYFSSLTKENVVLDTSNSKFIAGSNNTIYKVITE